MSSAELTDEARFESDTGTVALAGDAAHSHDDEQREVAAVAFMTALPAGSTPQDRDFAASEAKRVRVNSLHACT